MTIREILFPSDLTPESDLAFDHARLLAERFGAALTLYHVADAPTTATLTGRSPTATRSGSTP